MDFAIIGLKSESEVVDDALEGPRVQPRTEQPKETLLLLPGGATQFQMLQLTNYD